MYYGGYGYYDDDWMWGMAIGTTMVVAASAASDDDDDETTIINTTPAPAAAAPTAGTASLPCDPSLVQSNGMTYYKCAEQHYVLAYGGAGPIYIPVPRPPAEGAPGAAAPATPAGAAGARTDATQ